MHSSKSSISSSVWFVVLLVVALLSLAQVTGKIRHRHGKVSNNTFKVDSDSDDVTHIVGGSQEDTDFERKYSSWSPWSICSKKCKQLRMRRCVKAAHCGGAILREERRCHRERCPSRNSESIWRPVSKKNRTVSSSSATKSTTPFRGTFNFHHFVYSEWSSWSFCSSTCEATRYKVCLVDLFCGGHVLYEEAFCYRTGSVCERIYLRRRARSRRYRLEEPPESFRLDSLSPEPAPNNVACGIPKINTPDRMLRILGGQPAPRGKWPWQVVILNRFKEAFCGGTLVAESWVLTAAHCARKRLFVRVGEHDLSTYEGSEEQIRVIEVYIHPQYDSETVDNDIALLKLGYPLRYGDYISPVCIPHFNTQLPREDETCVILGWGKEKHGAMYGSAILQEARVPIVERQDCVEVYQDYYISPNMFCAGYKRGRVDSCAGDSGGPLLCQMEDKWYVMGITSFGEGCGRKEKYGIYTKVPNFAHWLHRIIRTRS